MASRSETWMIGRVPAVVTFDNEEWHGEVAVCPFRDSDGLWLVVRAMPPDGRMIETRVRAEGILDAWAVS